MKGLIKLGMKTPINYMLNASSLNQMKKVEKLEKL